MLVNPTELAQAKDELYCVGCAIRGGERALDNAQTVDEALETQLMVRFLKRRHRILDAQIKLAEVVNE